jgi:hypothetical protein
MKESKMYTLRKTGRMNFGVHTGHNSAGNITANRITVFKILTFGPIGKNSEIKRQPIRNEISRKEIQVMEKK